MIIDCQTCRARWDVSVKTHVPDADLRAPDDDRVVIDRYGITCPGCGQKGVYKLIDSRTRLMRLWEQDRGAA